MMKNKDVIVKNLNVWKKFIIYSKYCECLAKGKFCS